MQIVRHTKLLNSLVCTPGQLQSNVQPPPMVLEREKERGEGEGEGEEERGKREEIKIRCIT